MLSAVVWTVEQSNSIREEALPEPAARSMLMVGCIIDSAFCTAHAVYGKCSLTFIITLFTHLLM